MGAAAPVEFPSAPSRVSPLPSRLPALLIKALAIYSTAVVWLIAFLVLAGSSDPTARAVILMALGLLLIWVVCGGSLMFLYREGIRARVLALPGSWQVKFVFFASGLLLLEEVVTTAMTNLAPAFGGQVGVAYITASNNYFLVTAFASVSVLFPAYIGWAWLLKRYDFTPNEVFLLYGLLGTTSEASLNAGSLFAGFWFFVYGLMIYLPAYSIPSDRGAVRPRARHFVLAYFVPLACQIPAVIAVTLLKGWLAVHLFTG
jgi:hypothetical protein